MSTATSRVSAVRGSLRHWTLRAASVAAVGLSAVSNVAVAQERDTSLTPGGLEEITVTARRVEESLQRTPIAVTAVTAAAIEERNLINVLDAGATAPNVLIQQNGSVQGAANNPAVFIRGVGQSDLSPTSTPAVGMYVDGVYISSNLGNIMNLLDLKQVEILRGPQGTLFGRNTIGGAISLVSQPPESDLSGTAEVAFGDDSLRRARVSVNAPISDTVLTRFAAFANRQDGYVHLTNYPDKAYGDSDEMAFRGQLRLLPTDNVTIDLSADYSRGRGSGTPGVLRAAGQNAPDAPPGPPAPVALIYNLFLSGDPACLTASGQATNPICWGPVQVPADPYRSDAIFLSGSALPLQNVGPRDDYDIYGVNGTVDWQLGALNFKSITSYRDRSADYRLGVGNFLYFQINTGDTRRQFSQEIQLTGQAFQDRLKWVAGAYYFNESGNNPIELVTALAVVTPIFPTLVRATQHIDNDNLAFFGQTIWDITDRLHLTTGLRWTKERNSETAVGLFPAPQDLAGKQDSKEWTPLVTLSADLTEDVMGYLNYARGYRSGGFPARITGVLTSIPSYGPEFVDSYEAGLKTSFLERRLTVNGTVFYMSYSDVQVNGTNTEINPPVPATINAGDATLRGAELEVSVAASRYLRLEASAGYLDNELDNINSTAVDDGLPVTLDKQLPYAPEWKLAAGASLTWPLASGVFTGRIDWNHVSRHFFSIGNYDLASEDGYEVLNASLAYEFGEDRWKAEIVGKNLTNERYFTGGYHDFGFTGTAASTLARPRYVFAKISYSF